MPGCGPDDRPEGAPRPAPREPRPGNPEPRDPERRRDRCLNCGALLAGPFCHDCGQPVKGLIRQFRSVFGDFLDTVFEYDSRIWRTLLPLYFRPGSITLNFIAGRRVRYVTPFRLTFVALVAALLVLQVGVIEVDPASIRGEPGFSRATTAEEVEAARQRALAELDDADAPGNRQEGAAAQDQRVEAARRAVESAAERRLEWIQAVDAARREGREPPPDPGIQVFLNEDYQAWDPDTNPVTVSWLPDFANTVLNRWIGRALVNARAAQEDPAAFVDRFLGLVPVALFALLPLFAALLKLFYLFTGRLYMEHMLVALHSHAFFGLALIVTTLLQLAAQALPAGSLLQSAMDGLATLSAIWIPVYLLIMQRRVYAQGWLLTVSKFLVLGAIYLALLVVVVGSAALATLILG